MGVTTGKMAFQPNIVTDGLVLNLDAINPNSYPQSGTIWYDTSGYGNNGTLTNGTSWTPNGSQTSFSFDGVDDYVISQNNPILSVMTCSVWAKVINLVNNRYFFNKLPSNANNSNYGLNFNSDFSLRLGSWNGSTGSEIFSNYKVPANTWFNVVGIYNSSSSSIYINGVLDNVGFVSPVNSGSKITIGANPAGVLYPINALIPIFHLYNRVLTASEILQNYNALKSRFGLS